MHLQAQKYSLFAWLLIASLFHNHIRQMQALMSQFQDAVLFRNQPFFQRTRDNLSGKTGIPANMFCQMFGPTFLPFFFWTGMVAQMNRQNAARKLQFLNFSALLHSNQPAPGGKQKGEQKTDDKEDVEDASYEVMDEDEKKDDK